MLKEILKIDSDDDVQVTGAAKNVATILLLNKSREKYEFAYKRFINYCHVKYMTTQPENVVITYFFDLSAKASITESKN